MSREPDDQISIAIERLSTALVENERLKVHADSMIAAMRADNERLRALVRDISATRDTAVAVSEHEKRSERVTELAFLFRRDLAKVLRRPNELIMAATVFGALVHGSQFSIDQLTMLYHPNKQKRRDAAQKIVDDLEFKFESEIKKLEFTGDFKSAKAMRRQMQETRAGIENKVGKLAIWKVSDVAPDQSVKPAAPV